mgnify:CR=1 FL=1
MKKVILGLFLCMFLIGLVIAEENNSVEQNNTVEQNSSVNCTVDSDCLTDFECAKNVCVAEEEDDEDENETENDDEDEGNVSSGRGRGLGQTIRNRVHAGIYTNEDGDEIRVSEMARNKIRLMVKNKSADCDECNITEEKDNNKTKLKIHLSNGKAFEIKIMPNTVSERALEKLKLKFCDDSNNCTIQLKEVGIGNKTRVAYEIQVERHYKLLLLFKAKALNKAQVDAETGEIVIVKKPWWAFLASKSD